MPFPRLDRVIQIPPPSPDALPDWETVADRLDPLEFINRLDEALGGLEPCEDPIWNGRRFFAALDREANAFLLQGRVLRGELHQEEVTQRLWIVGALSRTLRARRAMRDLVTGELPPRAPVPDRVQLEAIVGMVEGLVLKYFAGDRNELREAFERFTVGELRLPLPALGVATTQPSSENYFLFEELGDCCRAHQSTGAPSAPPQVAKPAATGSRFI